MNQYIDGLLLGTALACSATLLLIGRAVSEGPPAAIDLHAQRRLFSRFTGLATFFTKCGYTQGILAAFALAAVFLSVFSREKLPALLALLIAQGVSQLVCNSLKANFKRVRPEKWLHRHEVNAAYPSGHASTAIVTYGGIFALLLVNAGNALLESVFEGGLLVFVLGIGWSRIALGAHHLSDVAGGYLAGIATLCVTVMLLRVLGLALL